MYIQMSVNAVVWTFASFKFSLNVPTRTVPN